MASDHNSRKATQILYTKNDIGLKKTEACKNFLTATDPEVNYEGHCKKIETVADLVTLFLFGSG